jgi:hemerythrin-like domain-containing protein
MTPPTFARRHVLLGSAAGLVALGSAAASAARPENGKENSKKNGKKKPEEIGPGEDLMREHGVLRRALLVYREAGRRLAVGEFDAGALADCARLIRRFVEDYHERQEEDFVFPRFERANKLTELVSILRTQHQAGRALTEKIQTLTTPATLKDPQQRRQLITALDGFVRMYEPHAAREDTVLFPALREIVTPAEYDALGEDFEKRERQLFGGDGFEQAVGKIDAIEKKIGIEDLAVLTP